MTKRLVLIGGGHAHMVALSGIADMVGRGIDVTVIQPSDHHYYSGMGPGMLSGTYRPEEIRFATRQVVQGQGGRFIRDRATRIDAAAKTVILENGAPVAYDVLSCNAGSHVPRLPLVGDVDDLFTVKPIERLMTAKQRLIDHFGRHPTRVVIIGGGPSAAEVAGNIWQLGRTVGKKMPQITVCAGKAFMARFSQAVRRRILTRLGQRGVVIREGDYATSLSPEGVHLDGGEMLPADLVFLALGVKPSSIFTDSGLPTGPDGGLRVNRFLQSTGHPDIFGGGDCIHFEAGSLDKVGVYAVRENPVLYHNMVAQLEGGELQAFDPGGDYLLIFNLGGGAGVLEKRGIVFGGRPAFVIKDFIDRRFMRRFQALESGASS